MGTWPASGHLENTPETRLRAAFDHIPYVSKKSVFGFYLDRALLASTQGGDLAFCPARPSERLDSPFSCRPLPLTGGQSGHTILFKNSTECDSHGPYCSAEAAQSHKVWSFRGRWGKLRPREMGVPLGTAVSGLGHEGGAGTSSLTGPKLAVSGARRGGPARPGPEPFLHRPALLPQAREEGGSGWPGSARAATDLAVGLRLP